MGFVKDNFCENFKKWAILIKADELASALQGCIDNGAKKVLLAMTSTVNQSPLTTSVVLT